jgi:MFS transporter, PAT family, beta-lactamase induction signal transducer AmpG
MPGLLLCDHGEDADVNPIQDLLKVFGSRKMAALLVLGFSSGLPLYLVVKDPLQAWLTQEGVNLETIGYVGLVGLPYSFKFLWAPLLDRFVPPFLGRRRGWMLVFQALLLLSILLLSFFQRPSQSLQMFTVVAVGVAFFGASQDIVVDAYRSDVTDTIERGPGASLFLLGYRIATLVAGALTFYLASFMPWHQVYRLMALLMLIGMVASWWAPEPDRQVVPPRNLRDSVILPFSEFIERNGALKAALILVFILLYKLGDSVLKKMATPFLLRGLHFTERDLSFPNALAIVAVIFGSLVGGVIMTQIGINRSLWLFAGFQAIGNLSYVALAIVGKNFPLMLTAINLENFCVGLESAAFVAFLMSLCNPAFSVTQYALLSSLPAVSRDILVAPAGTWAQNMGWPSFFLMTALLALPGLLLLPFFAPWNADRAD